MIEIYENEYNKIGVNKIKIDQKFITGYYFNDGIGALVIYTSFGKIFILQGIPTWELKTAWDLDIGKERLDAFKHNMEVLGAICV